MDSRLALRTPRNDGVLGVALFLFAAFAFALDFPALTGRVVDQAGVMTAQSKSDSRRSRKRWKTNPASSLSSPR